jgi:hypothetical protein
MSPARVVEATQKENDFQTVTSALDALLVTVHQLSLREQELQRRVKLAHDEVSIIFSPFFSCPLHNPFLVMRKISNLLALDREPHVGRDIFACIT